MFEKDNKANIELEELSPTLAGFSKSIPFELPEPSYLRHFSEQVNERKDLLADKVEIYEIPENYFIGFSEEVIKLIRKLEVEIEIKELSPLISQIDRKLPYSRPVDESLETESVRKDAKQRSRSGVIQLFSSKAVRFAVAACFFAGALTLAIGMLLNQNKVNEQVQVPVILSEKEYDEVLASLDDESIIDYLHQEGIPVNQDDLETYIDNDALPDEVNLFDPELSDDFFQSLEEDLMKDSIDEHEKNDN